MAVVPPVPKPAPRVTKEASKLIPDEETKKNKTDIVITPEMFNASKVRKTEVIKGSSPAKGTKRSKDSTRTRKVSSIARNSLEKFFKKKE